ncbi:hypothetical protein [Sorangium cellulosum]|uniref:hypothetical protein n=1 Tax=Sorangium cellulosum TaxID=56 RepID=UPI0013EC3EE1|nr:hypothetical protein [Sorangium cellulosum]
MIEINTWSSVEDRTAPRRTSIAPEHHALGARGHNISQHLTWRDGRAHAAERRDHPGSKGGAVEESRHQENPYESLAFSRPVRARCHVQERQ